MKSVAVRRIIVPMTPAATPIPIAADGERLATPVDEADAVGGSVAVVRSYEAAVATTCAYIIVKVADMVEDLDCEASLC